LTKYLVLVMDDKPSSVPLYMVIENKDD